MGISSSLVLPSHLFTRELRCEESIHSPPLLQFSVIPRISAEFCQQRPIAHRLHLSGAVCSLGASVEGGVSFMRCDGVSTRCERAHQTARAAPAAPVRPPAGNSLNYRIDS